MKNCNIKPLQFLAEGNQTLLPQQTTTVIAVVITTNTNNVTGAIQPLPQFDVTATIIVAPALATAHNKRIKVRIANATDFPHTIKNRTNWLNTKFASTNQLERRHASLIGGKAHVRHNNNSAVLKICKPIFRTMQTKRQVTSTR